MSGCLDVNLHVVLHVHAAKVDTEQTGVEPGSVAVTYIANTRLGLTKRKGEESTYTQEEHTIRYQGPAQIGT